jgi:hypothetical protein
MRTLLGRSTAALLLVAAVIWAGALPASASTATVYVAANASTGVSTGVFVAADSIVDFTSTGTAGYGYESTAGCVGYPTTHPDGSRYVNGVACSPLYKNDTNAKLSGGRVGGLVARVGSGTWFAVYGATSVSVVNSGTLYLAYNDSIYSDNVNGYTVTVTARAGSGGGDGCVNVCKP